MQHPKYLHPPHNHDPWAGDQPRSMQTAVKSILECIAYPRVPHLDVKSIYAYQCVRSVCIELCTYAETRRSRQVIEMNTTTSSCHGQSCPLLVLSLESNHIDTRNHTIYMTAHSQDKIGEYLALAWRQRHRIMISSSPRPH